MILFDLCYFGLKDVCWLVIYGLGVVLFVAFCWMCFDIVVLLRCCFVVL